MSNPHVCHHCGKWQVRGSCGCTERLERPAQKATEEENVVAKYSTECYYCRRFLISHCPYCHNTQRTFNAGSTPNDYELEILVRRGLLTVETVAEIKQKEQEIVDKYMEDCIECNGDRKCPKCRGTRRRLKFLLCHPDTDELRILRLKGGLSSEIAKEKQAFAELFPRRAKT